MNQPIKKNLRIAALAVAFFFATTLIASPAFSRDRHFYRNYRGSHHVRVVRDAGILPALLATGIIAGITLSLIDNAANPPVPECRVATRTYAPVAPPVAYAPIVSQPHDGGVFDGSVMVTAQLLNVRTGPSLGEASIRQIPYGTVLSVYGGSPGWYYVSLPGNQYGWVMTQFTAPLEYSGAG